MKPSVFASIRNTSLILAVVAAICGAGVIATVDATASSGNALATVARTTRLHSGDLMTGAVPLSQPIHVEVALKLRNRGDLDSFIVKAAKNSLRGTLKPMSRSQFMENHAPTQVQAQTVANYLSLEGFRNVVIAPNHMLVSADGTAYNARGAFLTSFARIRTHDGRTAFANTADAHVPAALKDIVLSVVGLQTVHQAHVFAQQFTPKARTYTLYAITGHNPNDFSSIYGGTGVATAAGVSVGIISQGLLTQTITDLNTFTTNNGLAPVATQIVDTNGTSTDISNLAEWSLDSQDVVGMAGGQVGKLIFYNIPTLLNTDLTADINTVVAANATKIINVSLGECELDAQADGSAAAQDQSFAVAIAQGQTFSISTGDSGANECPPATGTTPSWPAASQYVIATAGTTLNASTTSWGNETVWQSSGGSQSTFEPKPSWQILWPGPFRGVADIAFDASPSSGAKVIVNGVTQQWGGTSLSAPIFAGMWARVIAVKGTTVGFAGPLIYNLPATDFHDVTSGYNGISAGVGYDLASGRGSIILNQAINHIGSGGSTPVATFSFTTNGLSATFTDSSTDTGGTIASRIWNFGDGSTSTATNPSYAFAASGTYSVAETVTDNLGASNTMIAAVKVTGPAGSNVLSNGVAVTGLAATAGNQFIYTMNVPAAALSLKFATSGGLGDADLYVRFGAPPTLDTFDCRSYTNTTNETCKLATVQAGTYYVMVYSFASFTGVSLVGNYSTSLPVANFSYTTTGLTANFTDSSTDTGGSIASYAWTFGDGGTSTAANPSHAYAVGGTYNVTETVTDNLGATSSKTSSVKVIKPSIPVANFSYTTNGLTASFIDSSTDTGGRIASHAWTFGDGGTSTATNPSHTYAAGGTYSVTETVTDNLGATSSKTSSVTISISSTPVANFSYTTSGLTANFTDSSTDTGGSIVSYAWTFGDGGTSAAANPSHTYAASGTYNVTETVTDNLGATSSKTSSVPVSISVIVSQLLGNTGFETGTAAPWATTRSGMISNSPSEPANGGNWEAWLGGLGSAHTDVLSQQVAIPSGMTSATLSFYLHIDTAETGTTIYDRLRVQVFNTSGNLLGVLAVYSNLNKATGYVVHNLSMNPYIGQTVVLKFTGIENAALQTSFVLDDITVNVQ